MNTFKSYNLFYKLSRGNTLIGSSYSEYFIINKKVVEHFAEFSGDRNPLHLYEEFAKKSFFKNLISHCAIPLSYIRKMLASKLLGDGTILIELLVNDKENETQKIFVEAKVYDEKKTEIKNRDRIYTYA